MTAAEVVAEEMAAEEMGEVVAVSPAYADCRPMPVTSMAAAVAAAKIRIDLLEVNLALLKTMRTISRKNVENSRLTYMFLQEA